MTSRAAGAFFVSFEGPEGSGKSLQSQLLVERLETAGRQVFRVREPGGTPLGNQLRALLLSSGDLALTSRSEALLFCAARAQLVETVIRPAMEQGAVVVCDRYADSTLAYQGHGSGLDVRALRTVLSFATADLWPDMTMLLDLPVQDGLARKAAQGARQAGAWNRFEAEASAYHERVRAGYRALAAAEPDRWRVFDARRSPRELADAIWAAVCPRLE